MFKTRLLSGILLVIIALATIISGGYVLFFTLLAVSLIGMSELYKVMKVQDGKLNLLAAAGYAGAVLYYLAMLLDFEKYGVLAIIFGLVLIMFVYVFTYPKYEAVQVMPALFGIVYVAVMLLYFIYCSPASSLRYSSGKVNNILLFTPCPVIPFAMQRIYASHITSFRQKESPHHGALLFVSLIRS